MTTSLDTIGVARIYVVSITNANATYVSITCVWCIVVYLTYEYYVTYEYYNVRV